MARRKRTEADVGDAAVEITPNQIVAFNLAEARALRGWTQEEAAAELERYIGTRWSKATFSAAERSIDGRRVRQFTADEIVSFAYCFQLPIGYFFMPPRPSQSETPLRLMSMGQQLGGLTLAELVDAVFGTPHGNDVMAERLRSFVDEISTSDLTEVQERMTSAAEEALSVIAMKHLARFDEWQEALTGLARQLGHWKTAAKAAAIRERRQKEAEDG